MSSQLTSVNNIDSSTRYVWNLDCLDFIDTLKDKEVQLFLFDPPYYKCVKDSWDNQWKTVEEYVDWMYLVLEKIHPKLADNGSIVFFGGIGKHGERPLFNLMNKIEQNNLYQYRNMLTWSKRRGFGKEFDYLFCREEIVWYSKSFNRKEVVFNIPLLDIKRGYDGFNKKYKAKSEFKRRTNVITDIPELMRPKRNTQKPLSLMDVFVKTHSNPGDLVVDLFVGSGQTALSSLNLDREFKGCEAIEKDAESANNDCVVLVENKLKKKKVPVKEVSEDNLK